MAKYIQGWTDMYGKIYPTEKEAAEADRTHLIYKNMYSFIESCPPPKWSRNEEVADYIIHYYSQIKGVVEDHG